MVESSAAFLAEKDRERICAVYRKPSRKGGEKKALNGGLYDIVSVLARRKGFRKAAFVQEMVMAGILSCPSVKEEFEGMVAAVKGEEGDLIRLYVNRVRALLK